MSVAISGFGIVFGEQVDRVFPSSGESMSNVLTNLFFLFSSMDLEILLGFALKSNGCSSEGVLQDLGVVLLEFRFLL
jgi:hypothetical protein